MKGGFVFSPLNITFDFISQCFWSFAKEYRRQRFAIYFTKIKTISAFQNCIICQNWASLIPKRISFSVSNGLVQSSLLPNTRSSWNVMPVGGSGTFLEIIKQQLFKKAALNIQSNRYDGDFFPKFKLLSLKMHCTPNILYGYQEHGSLEVSGKPELLYLIKSHTRFTFLNSFFNFSTSQN